MDVHTFYYPWYGNPAHDGAYKHWNHELIPHWDKKVAARYPPGQHDPTDNDVAAAFFPRLGVRPPGWLAAVGRVRACACALV
jgi:glycoprotein endo-alpha-1,2-mannosidase